MFGKRAGRNSPFAKKVINTLTNEIYPSVKDAANLLKMNYSCLTKKLRENKNFYLRYL
jgi:hypothetical protein